MQKSNIKTKLYSFINIVISSRGDLNGKLNALSNSVAIYTHLSELYSSKALMELRISNYIRDF